MNNGTDPFFFPQGDEAEWVVSHPTTPTGDTIDQAAFQEEYHQESLVGERRDAPPRTMPLVSQQRHRRRPQVALVVTISAILTLVSILLLPLLLSSQFAPAAPASIQMGQVVFSSSGQLDPTSSRGVDDIVTVNLHRLGTPGYDKSFYAWLLPEDDQIKPLLLGKGIPTKGTWQILYQSPDHTNLLATFSIFRVTEEDSSSNPVTPTLDRTAWRYEGSIPNSPIPGDARHYSLLSHLRHLTAKDPTLEQIGLSGGLDIWLYRNSQKIMEYTTAARDGWPSGNSGVDLLRHQIIRTLQYLDGANYSWQDTGKVPWLIDPKAGKIGLLDFTQNQNPPGYLSHVLLHLGGLVSAPGATTTQKQLAVKIDHVMKPITFLYRDIRTDAIKLVKMSNQQILQSGGLTLLDDMATKASAAYAGQTDAVTGELQPGITWIHGQIQTLATFSVLSF